jgi:two-component system chemotaxis sensor kinase CheA
MAEDLHRYFAIEARELVAALTEGTLQVERSGALTPEQRKQLLRLAHTLKGAARVVKESAIADTAHAIEDLIAAAGDPVDRTFGSRVLGLLDTIVQGLPPEDLPPAPAQSAAAADDAMRAVRVEFALIDNALARLADISSRCSELSGDLDAAAAALPAAVRHVPAGVDALCGEIARLRSHLHEMRLAPASTVFLPLERAVRDAAQASGVRARFAGSGGDHRLDADVLLAVRDALIQLVRNAVAHGIEPPKARAAAGKPLDGVVALAVERRGADIAFVLSDDGRGLDFGALRQALSASGTPDRRAIDRLSDQDLVSRLLQGGLSSQRTVSQISGRGVGLDLVRSVVTRYNGRLSLRNDPGRGVTVELVLPVSLRSLSYLRVETASHAALLPLDAVRGTARLAGAATLELDGRLHLTVENRPLPLVALHKVLGNGANAAAGDDRVAVLVQSGNAMVAVAAERFAEAATTVAQALPPFSAASAVVRGVAIDAGGRIVPVLEPAALLDAAATRGPSPPRETPRVARLLVVDDSITTRMLEQSILEAAGYVVEAAASAEEALARAATVTYDLFIVDVEMPGMNGFEFVAATRADARLAQTPAMLVTSRSSDADKRRGRDVGARAYVVKGEFDQESFLSTVRGLIG